MSQYGKIAVLATELYRAEKLNSPRCAWKDVAQKVFPDSPPSQNKNCPRSAYLGLCKDGFVHGVPPGNYTRSVDNKAYAVTAIAVLKQCPALADDEFTDVLWNRVLDILKCDWKHPNEQMDVVVALWNNGDIKK